MPYKTGTMMRSRMPRVKSAPGVRQQPRSVAPRPQVDPNSARSVASSWRGAKVAARASNQNARQATRQQTARVVQNRAVANQDTRQMAAKATQNRVASNMGARQGARQQIQKVRQNTRRSILGR